MTADRAPLPFDAPAVERGVGLFETIGLIGRRVSLFHQHVARLRSSAAQLDLPVPTIEQVIAAAHAAVERSATVDESALRLTWLAIGNNLDDPSAWRLDASTRQLPAATLRRRLGCHAVTLPAELMRDTPAAKSTSYFAAVLGARYADRGGADEGLFVAADSSYLEGTATGVIGWDGGRLATSSHAILPSVTAAAFQNGSGARRLLTRADLRAGAIVVGALTRAAPLRTLDGEPCDQPPEMIERIESFHRWLDAEAVPIAALA